MNKHATNEAKRRQTLASRLTGLSHKIGNLIERPSWRMFWQGPVYSYLYNRMSCPWFDGTKWTDGK